MPRARRSSAKTIRGFRYVSQLAESPVSSVYLAESEKNGSKVALKVLHQPPDEGAGVSNFDRFLREYQIAAAIEHPNIARVHDFVVADDHAFIAMEYFPLGDLRGRIKQASAAAGADIPAPDGRGAQGAARRGRAASGPQARQRHAAQRAVSRLIDYGLSKHIELDASLTNNGEIFGTPTT
jgi:hypothetical protein